MHDDYCMAECASRQDEVNPVFRTLATWVGKMGVSCPLGVSHVCPARKSYPSG